MVKFLLNVSKIGHKNNVSYGCKKCHLYGFYPIKIIFNLHILTLVIYLGIVSEIWHAQ